MLYREAFSRPVRVAGKPTTGQRQTSSLSPGRRRGGVPPAACGVGALLALACATSQAANWEVAPRVAGGYRYSDNYRLDYPGQEVDVSGAEVDAQVEFRTVGPRTEFSVTPRIRSTYFPDESDEDSNDYFLEVGLRDATPRRRMGFDADFSREDVVRSELPSADVTSDLGQPDAVDAGRVLERNRRDLIQLFPYLNYDVSQRQRVEVAAHFTDADFDRDTNEQVDFRQYGVSAGWGYAATERSSWTVRALASKYETTRDADAFGAEVEWGTQFTENSRFYVRLGAQQTEPEVGDKSTDVIAGVGGRWSAPRNELFLDFTRSVNAVAAGTVMERHQLRMRIDHDVSPTVTVLAGIRALREEPIDGTVAYPEREYVAAETGLEWRWTRTVSLAATYNYRWQEYSDDRSDRSSNGFLISVIYEPRRAE